MGRGPSDYRMRLERLRMAREPDEIREATDVYLKHHQLPDDVDVLYKVLMHPSEKIVREALGQLSSLIMQGRIGEVTTLGNHLTELGARATEPATRSFIDGVKSQVDKLAKP